MGIQFTPKDSDRKERGSSSNWTKSNVKPKRLSGIEFQAFHN
jgi:hypothetical protein